ncbi:MAG: PDDEXK nuclease domain-containing protein [Candidatus Margulisiibacteriota bacterium]
MPPKLFSDIRDLIIHARVRVAQVINSELPLLYWHIGSRIKKEVLHDQRAEYGKQVIQKLSDQLTLEFGTGWSKKQLQHCLRSAEVFTKEEILYAVRRELSWTHLRSLFSIEDKQKRSFYLEMCVVEHWATRTLDEKIEGLLFERTAISRKPDQVIQHEISQLKETGEISSDLVFRSTYFLDFLGLKDVYSEKDLEEAILVEIQKFINELGSDFAFLGRQKRITVDSTDYYIDLLFFHRGLRRLVVIDLKLGKFKPEYEGQMLLYLRFLDKNERRQGEESPIGLILCSEGNTEHIEYLMLEGGNIKVAQYLTELPNKKELEAHLHKAIQLARQRFEERKNAQGKKIGTKTCFNFFN